MIPDPLLKKFRYELILAGIILLSGFLYFYNLSQNGYSNTYYAAAVRSILSNPAVMLWGSFDPAGFVTVDKPPVAIWVQTVSAVIFGYTGWALILPQAVAGVCSVLLLYLVISRSFGKPTGLIAAFVLTITPIAVAVGRTNNLDGLLVFVLLLAFITAMEAWRRGSLPLLVATAILVGIGFNIKMIEAFAVVPAFFGIYLLSKPIPLKTRIAHLAGAGAVLLVISFSWAVMVDMTPADQRPYIGSSEHNSALELIFGYNGLSRIIGKADQPGDGTGGFNRTMTSQGFQGMPGGEMPAAPPFMDGNFTPGGNSPAPGNLSAGPGQSGAGMPSPGPGGMNEGGTPGLFRLGNEEMAAQISWLIPFALIGALVWLRRPSLAWLRDLSEQEIVVLASLLWLIPELGYFSLSSGHFHRYYLVMVAPPLAALVAIGAVRMHREYRDTGMKGWLLVLAIPVTGIVQAFILRYTPDFSGFLPWGILSVSLVAGAVLAALRFHHLQNRTPVITGVIVLVCALLLVAPAIWSCTPLLSAGNGAIPVAGPDLGQGRGMPGGQMPGMGHENTDYEGLISYLQSHRGNETYLAGVTSANSGGSELIVRTGEAVMAIGGFSGSDSILTNETLQEMVHAGDIRYFFLSQHMRGGPGTSSAEAISWIPDSCAVVPDSDWNTNSSADTRSGRGNVLYDCRGA